MCLNKKIVCFLYFLIGFFSVVTASETKSIFCLPQEIQNYIFSFISYDQSNCPIHCCKYNDTNGSKKTYLSNSFIPNKLHAPGTPYQAYFLHTHLITIENQSYNTLQLHLCNHQEQEENSTNHKENIVYGTCCSVFFDGLNKNGKGIIAKPESGEFFYLYCLNMHAQKTTKKCSSGQSNYLAQYSFLKPLFTENAHLRSLMIHPDDDTIVFSTTKVNYKNLSHQIITANITENDLTNIRSVDLPQEMPIKKIIYLGKKTYLALTFDYQLIVLWEKDDGTITYCKQKHISRFIDIAVDNTIQTSKGFKPHIACLNDKYELFVVNVLAFKQPILFFLKKIPNPHSFENSMTYFYRLYYDNQQLLIIYKNIDTLEYGNALILNDKLGLFYMKKVLQPIIEKLVNAKK